MHIWDHLGLYSGCWGNLQVHSQGQLPNPAKPISFRLLSSLSGLNRANFSGLSPGSVHQLPQLHGQTGKHPYAPGHLGRVYKCRTVVGCCIAALRLLRILVILVTRSEPKIHGNRCGERSHVVPPSFWNEEHVAWSQNGLHKDSICKGRVNLARKRMKKDAALDDAGGAG